ncbi:MAG: DUF4262 domain-containing protein [Acidobacteria bacterium]|nr:DUF4262 domain-containing protein [Acidobacteriota bacterium]
MSERDERTISNVETFGCEVVQVKRNSAGPGWSYTLGVHDTCGQPEVITVGLREETAHFSLNEAADRLRNGINLAEGRHRDIVGEVECEFRPVDPKWVRRLMGWAVWYYDGGAFPVLQAVYPDRDNRFPEHPDFDSNFRQPLLQPDAPETAVERDFWASADPDSSLFNWMLPDPPHTLVFLSKPVQSDAEPITYVSHDIEDGAWQFLGTSMSGGDKPVISCFHHLIDKDSSLKELADLPLGWYAERAERDAPWVRRKHDEESA